MGLKKTSNTIAVSFSVTESAANTLTSDTVQLPLDPLNNEVFVVQMLDIDPQGPDSIAGTSTSVDVTVSTTSRTSVGSLAAPNVMGIARRGITMNAGSVDGVTFQSDLPVAAAPQMDYLAIIATDDFHVNILGTNNNNPKTCQGRIYGYRAKADAAAYAALVQSELLS
tara:strand:+ start:272 stop:775 length:504 start_codon:yes stop_codon:yes gene_type:complete